MSSTIQQFKDLLGRRVLLHSLHHNNGVVKEATIKEVSENGHVKWSPATSPDSQYWSTFDSIEIVDVLPDKSHMEQLKEGLEKAHAEKHEHRAAHIAALKDAEDAAVKHANELKLLQARHDTEKAVLTSKMPIASKVGLPDPELPTRTTHPNRVHVPAVKTPPTLETT
jgi:hypothetical protein